MRMIAYLRLPGCPDEDGGAAAYLPLLPEFSPVIEPEASGGAWFDLSGSRPEEIAAVLGERLREKGLLPARLGVAVNKRMARLAAGLPDAHERMPGFLYRRILPGQEAECLSRVKISFAGSLSRKTMKKLDLLGYRTYGDLQALEADALMGLFGSDGRELYHRSRGLDYSPLLGLYPPDRLTCSLIAEGLVSDRIVLKEIWRECGQRLCRILTQRQQGCRWVRLILTGEFNRYETERLIPWGCQRSYALAEILNQLAGSLLAGIHEPLDAVTVELSALFAWELSETDLFSGEHRPVDGEQVRRATIDVLREKYPDRILPSLQPSRREQILAQLDPWRWERQL